MDSPALVFKKDSSTGLPRLEANGFVLSDAEIRGLEAELKRKFEPLVHNGNGKIIQLDTPVRTFARPARFRLSVRRVNQRCPDLILEPVTEVTVGQGEDNGQRHRGAKTLADETDILIAADVAAIRRGDVSDWSAAFLAEVQKLLSKEAITQLERADCCAMQFVLEELQAIQAERPADMAPLMVAGYTALGERMCRDFADERIAMYVLAARGIDRLFESLLPKKATVEVQEDKHANGARRLEARIKLHQAGRFLARLLGIAEDPLF